MNFFSSASSFNRNLNPFPLLQGDFSFYLDFDWPWPLTFDLDLHLFVRKNCNFKWAIIWDFSFILILTDLDLWPWPLILTVDLDLDIWPWPLTLTLIYFVRTNCKNVILWRHVTYNVTHIRKDDLPCSDAWLVYISKRYVHYEWRYRTLKYGKTPMLYNGVFRCHGNVCMCVNFEKNRLKIDNFRSQFPFFINQLYHIDNIQNSENFQMTFDLYLSLTLSLTFDLDGQVMAHYVIFNDFFKVTWCQIVANQPEVSVTSGSKVMAHYLILPKMVTLTLPFTLKKTSALCIVLCLDIFCQNIRTIGPSVWPVEPLKTDKQTARQTDRGDQYTLRKSKISQSNKWQGLLIF